MNATNKQTWAIYCITGLDVRNIGLSKNIASDLIGRAKAGEDICDELLSMGAIGKPKKKINYEEIFNAAVEAGKKAAEEHVPTPMIVEEHSNPLDDSSPVKERHIVSDGVCGFAWIKFNGNTGFAKWMKKEGHASKSYPSGLSYWVYAYNQSMEKKEKFARAFADVLRNNGIKAYAQSRMD